MKRGVLNYSITWNENGEKHENLICTKQTALYEYLTIMRSGNTGISSLRIWECYKSYDRPAKDITFAVNRFIA